MKKEQKKKILNLFRKGISYRKIEKYTGVSKSKIGRFLKEIKDGDLIKNDEYKLTDKIPIPNKVKYPFCQMKVGHSFWVKENKSVLAAANSWSKTRKNNWEFTTKKENGGIRIWRMK